MHYTMEPLLDHTNAAILLQNHNVIYSGLMLKKTLINKNAQNLTSVTLQFVFCMFPSGLQRWHL